jgi:hypothetical protein
VDQVIHDLQFQVMHLTQRSQYMEVRMLETCIHTLMHHMPGRLWFHRGAGPYLMPSENISSTRKKKKGFVQFLQLNLRATSQKKRSRTQKVRGAWTQGENLKLVQAVHEMGTSWTAIASAEILPGRSVQSITNYYHRDLKNGLPLCETTISNDGAYEALQIWNDSPIPFQRDAAYKSLSASNLISKKSSKSPTLARLVEALSSADSECIGALFIGAN